MDLTSFLSNNILQKMRKYLFLNFETVRKKGNYMVYCKKRQGRHILNGIFSDSGGNNSSRPVK